MFRVKKQAMQPSHLHLEDL